jgi:hypothetical protein
MTKKPRRYSSRGKGELPNEYHRRSLVAIEPHLFERKFQQQLGDPPQMDHGVDRTRHYIVQTHRLDTVWTVVVEVEGVQTKLPAQVIATILRHRDTIIKQQRHDRAVAQAEAAIAKANVLND